MEKLKVVVSCGCGLHARPASMLVGTAMKFSSNISISKNDKSVNCKSIMGILSLGASKGDELEITVDGTDELAATSTLKDLFEVQFMKE